MLTNERQRIRKGRQGFGIPGSLTGRKGLLTQQLLSKNGDQRKESQEGRCGAQNGQIRPLALRLHAQMGAHLMKGDFDRPTHDKPCQDLNRVGLLVGTQHGPAWANLPSGSRISTQRRGTGGTPAWYHRAVPVAISTDRVTPPYQETVLVCHAVAGSARRLARVG